MSAATTQTWLFNSTWNKSSCLSGETAGGGLSHQLIEGAGPITDRSSLSHVSHTGPLMSHPTAIHLHIPHLHKPMGVSASLQRRASESSLNSANSNQMIIQFKTAGGQDLHWLIFLYDIGLWREDDDNTHTHTINTKINRHKRHFCVWNSSGLSHDVISIAGTRLLKFGTEKISH